MKSRHTVIAFCDEIDNELSYDHERHAKGICPSCDFQRVVGIQREFIRRLEGSEVGIRGLFMWSLGTSLSDTGANRKLLNERWHLFTKRMYHHTDWLPLFRVLEVGRRGFLHYHVVTGLFIKHSTVLQCWRSLTKEKSNVHVSGYKGVKDPVPLIRYLLKYLTKSSSEYRWMGPLYGVGESYRKAHSGARRRYMGHTCYEVVTDGYPDTPEEQGKLYIKSKAD